MPATPDRRRPLPKRVTARASLRVLAERLMRPFSPRFHPPATRNMTIHTILKMGDPRLLRVAQPVTAFDTPELHALIQDLFDTMADADGAGLAAPQIGVDLQLVIFGSATDARGNPRYPDEPVIPRTVLINPVITPLPPADGSSDQPVEVDGWEGCLSVPGLRGLVPRAGRIRYTGVDPFGKPIDRTVDGFHARVVQHECDHLIGRLYPTRMRDMTQFGFTSVLFPDLPPGDD
jgi:peptide deformylase